MIASSFLLLLASSAALAAVVNVTLPARGCVAHSDNTLNGTDGQPPLDACAKNISIAAISAALVNGTPTRKPQTIIKPTSEPTTYARTGVVEKRLVRTIRPIEEKTAPTETTTPTTRTRTRTRASIAAKRTIMPVEEAAFNVTEEVSKPTETPTHTSRTKVMTKTKTKTGTSRTIAPIEDRAFVPIEDVPTYTPKPKPTTKTRIGDIAAQNGVPIERRLTRPGDDNPMGVPTPTTRSKTKTRTRTPTLAPIEERSFKPIEDVPTSTPIGITYTKTKTKTRTRTPALAPIEERSFKPIEDVPTDTPIGITYTKTKTKTKPTQTAMRTIRPPAPVVD